LGGGFPGGDQFVGASEVVPDEGLDVGLDDDVSLRAPGEIGVVLDDREGATDDVGGGARGGEAAGLEVDGDGNVGAEQARAFNRNGGGEEAVHERAALELDGDEKSRVGAGASEWRPDRAARVVDGDAGVDVGGGDGEGRGEFFEGFAGSEALEVTLEAEIVGQAEPGGRPAAEVGESCERGDALHVVERDTGAIDGADQSADAGAGNAIDGDAGVFERADDADVGDAAGEASGEGEADAWAIAGGARFFFGEGLHLVGGVAQPVFGEANFGGRIAWLVAGPIEVGMAGLVVLVGHSEYSLVLLRRWVRLFDRGMLVL